MQVKLFTGSESGVEQLEKDINAWLAEQGRAGIGFEILQTVGNIAPQTMTGQRAVPQQGPSDLFVMFLYRNLP